MQCDLDDVLVIELLRAGREQTEAFELPGNWKRVFISIIGSDYNQQSGVQIANSHAITNYFK